MKNRKLIFYNIIGIAVIIYAVILLYGMTAASLSEVSVPNEFQEVTNILLTQDLLNGINPYSLKEAFGRDVPGLLYAYGPIYSLIVAPFARIFPEKLIFLHYLVSFLAMLMIAFLGAWMVKEKTETLAAPAAAFVLLINCTWRYGYINAVPDTLGLFWMMLALFLETREKCRGRELWEIIVIILAFYTKIYMAYIAIPLFVYKLITDHRAAARFTIYGVVLMGAVSAVVTIMCPLYWTYTIYFLHGPWNAQGGEPGYEMLQLRSLGGIFLFFFIVSLLAVLEQVKHRFKDVSKTVLLLIVDLIVSIPVMHVLGANDGAWLSYYLQIQIPPLVMLSLIYIENKCIETSSVYRRYAWGAFLFVMLSFTILRTGQRLPYYYMEPEQKKLWDDVYGLIDEYTEKGEVYYSPILTYHAIDDHQYFYNSGYVGVANEDFYDEYLNTKWQQTLFPYAGKVMKKNLEYKRELEEKIRNGGYSLIAVIEGKDGTDRAIRVSAIEDGPYRLLREVGMPVSRVNYALKFYVREDD